MRHFIAVFICLSLSTCQQINQLNPPRLDDDTLVNNLFDQNEKHPNTELVSENPPGSGIVVVLQSGPEFTLAPFQETFDNGINGEKLVKETDKTERDTNTVDELSNGYLITVDKPKSFL
eukprot:GFUD01057019.1.p1 GENE.GFUD01057019.1~~GFUD01057019.1.p1  ORF type:complete len:127 (+),score=33.73 GFUD01057019.1:26-382(+)